jgi:hypothetical protein
MDQPVKPIVVTDEMRRAVRIEACYLEGRHDFDIIVGFESDPVQVVCGRCGKSWNVKE